MPATATKEKKSSSKSATKLTLEREPYTLTKTGQRVSCGSCGGFDISIVGKGVKGFRCRCNNCNREAFMAN